MPSEILPPGVSAPDFQLTASTDEAIRLSALRGQPVILAFYPADWSPVCGDQMTLYNEVLDVFRENGAQLLGISVDGKWSHAAYARSKHLRFPLLSDFEPKGQVSRQYGAYDEAEGVSKRALFLLDAAGVITWSYLSPAGVNPGADGIFNALKDLRARA